MYKYFLLLIISSAFGQAPFSKDNPNTLAIKACAYVNLLDGGFGSIVGIEKGFLKNHSIGTKFIYNHFTPHTENEEGEPINYTDDKDISLVIEYKYYFDFNDFRQRTGISFYTSLSYKVGRNTIDKDRDYPNDYYNREIKYNFFGPAIGTVFSISESKKWTIDTQVGYLFGKKNLNTIYEVPLNYNKRETYDANLLRFEIMLAYNINW